MRYADYPRLCIGDIARLRDRLDDPATGVPPKRTDHNLLVATWNLFHFGDLHDSYDENPRSPKRNLRALASIAEVVRRFDVVAVQEVKRETTALRTLVDDFLGPDWSLVLSDVTEGESNNYERLAYVFDTRRVTPSGLAGEIVLPPTPEGNPAVQFARSPYVVGFRAGPGARPERFALLTCHIRYGDTPADRLPELQALAAYTAREIRDRSRFEGAEETNLILLGDFNIDRRSLDDPLFQAFLSEGLWVPEAIREFATTTGEHGEALRPDRVVPRRLRPRGERARGRRGLRGGVLPGASGHAAAVAPQRPLPAVGGVPDGPLDGGDGTHAGRRPRRARPTRRRPVILDSPSAMIGRRR